MKDIKLTNQNLMAMVYVDNRDPDNTLSRYNYMLLVINPSMHVEEIPKELLLDIVENETPYKKIVDKTYDDGTSFKIQQTGVSFPASPISDFSYPDNKEEITSLNDFVGRNDTVSKDVLIHLLAFNYDAQTGDYVVTTNEQL